MRQAKATERVQASEAQAQLRLQEQTQRADMLISELRRKLKETTDPAITNTRTAAELEVHLRKEILEAQQRRAELEPTWNMFIAKHNSEEEAREQERRWLRCLQSVAIEGSKMIQIESSCDCRRATSLRIWRPPLRTWRHLAAQTMSCLARLPAA